MFTCTSKMKFAPLALTSLALTLSACSGNRSNQGTAQQPATATILVDTSASTPFMASPTYSDAAIRRVGKAVAALHLGDKARIVAFGSRTTDHAVNVFAEGSGYKRHVPVLGKHVEAALRDLLANARAGGGDGSTNIIYTLENANVECTPRSRVIILTDGIEHSDAAEFDRALASKRPLRLPHPVTPFLSGGCSVEMVGIGVSPTGAGTEAETLPNTQLQSLVAAWRDWFTAAGLGQNDLIFTSIL